MNMKIWKHFNRRSNASLNSNSRVNSKDLIIKKKDELVTDLSNILSSDLSHHALR